MAMTNVMVHAVDVETEDEQRWTYEVEAPDTLDQRRRLFQELARASVPDATVRGEGHESLTFIAGQWLLIVREVSAVAAYTRAPVQDQLFAA
jgi:hypothetical protein